LTERDPPIAPHNCQDIRNQRLLIISSLFPPDALGGAEISSYEQALWLRKQGTEVGVLTTAKVPSEAHGCREIDGLKVWRVWMPRTYPQYYFTTAKWWQKPVWHLQDHLDPRNRSIVARVLDEFNPGHINMHLLQGIGYNVMREIGKRGIPATLFLHDLGLACIRMGMFKNGHACETHCAPCKVSAAYKLGCARTNAALEFVSPSRANLEFLAKYFPVKRWRHAVIMNANKYPAPTMARSESEHIRILYVGRLHATKGAIILLEAAQNLESRYKFSLTMVGSGPDETALRAKYGHLPWCKFTGFLSHQDISNIMVNSDILCIPSIWAENSPGVVIHALSLGLPVIGSDKAGIPELVEHGKNGLLVPPGDKLAWQVALERILQDPRCLIPWRDYALENVYGFDQDYLGNKMLYFINRANQMGKEEP
jgi:glycosyltransferase involved in cell wall biosynthesis